ncbi:beta-N-acetylhexosaminidase [Clostridium vincentii]|uniref:Putative lipoprotein YbbD n=1 Tax=Clostridium vincentii TaxID=52704 RepID=A0A2T0B5H0_9CLOT|nr:beta-N-acetylhexosaminidase [Clostridium vincentii]PRR79138.1 putative lipoprotein YbbD precursor [Clostridium vincentii]
MIPLFNKKSIIWTMVTLSLVFMIGCSSVAEPAQEEIKQPEKEIDPIEEQIKKMTLDEKIGQMVIIGLDGYTMDDNTRSMVENNRVGGFILFGENVKSSDQLLALLNSLKSTNSKNNIPLFISVDQEGGRVNRMPAEVKNLPSSKKIGKVNNEKFSYEIGNILGEEIKAFGFNMDFAPVLDINSNPKNSVIGDRAFGTNAEVVSKLGIQTMKGIQTAGVIPVVKHFPGHGDTAVDSHIGLPSVENDMTRLKSFELVPFNDAIQNGADAVMVAHIVLNKIDSENPASLSKTIITDLLRNEMNFDGLVITDDMTMGAIVKNYTISDAAIKSVNAGSDIVLVCHGYDNEVAVINNLKKAVEDGTISEERIDESIYRILKLKDKYKLKDSTLSLVDVEKINNKINNTLDIYLNGIN